MTAADMLPLLEEETSALLEVVGIALGQREALRQGRLDSLQDLVAQMRKAAFRAQQAEFERDAFARAFAAERGVDPRLSALADSLGGDDGQSLREAGRKLTRAVASVKSETQILSRLVEENGTLNDMLLSEWRRLQGKLPLSGGFDARG